MSDCFNYPLDYLDEQTINIVNGYIRNIQTLLSSSFNNIPREINHITITYIDDHFMLYRGTYQWEIDNKLLTQMLKAEPCQKFTSNIFEIGKLPWTIEVYPNGTNRNLAGDFAVCITLLSWPIKWNFMDIYCSIRIAETNTHFVFMQKYTPMHLRPTWFRGTLELNEIINGNIDKLTITLTNKILRIIANPTDKIQGLNDCIIYQSPINKYKKYYKFDFILNRSLMGNEKDWHRDKSFHSDIIDEIFCVNYFPFLNKLHLSLLGTPNKIDGKQCFVAALQIKWDVYIKIFDININMNTRLDYNIQVNHVMSIPSVTFNDLKQYETITFCNKIEILKEYDAAGNVVGVDVEDIWNKYRSKNDKIELNKKINKNVITRNATHDLDLDLDQNIDSLSRDVELVKSCLIKQSNEVCVLRERVEILEQKNEEMMRGNNAKHNRFKLWLYNEVKLGEYYDILSKNGYDNMNAISTMTLDRLEQIGIDKIGHRDQIMTHVAKLEKPNDVHQKMIYVVVGLLMLVFAVLCGRWSI